MCRWAFQDAHLTFEQKSRFWMFNFDGNYNGKLYEGQAWKLSAHPELSRMIYQAYQSHCQATRPLQSTVNLSAIQSSHTAPEDLTNFDTNCQCGALLNNPTDIYCEECWISFTVTAKMYEWQREFIAHTKVRVAAAMTTQAMNTSAPPVQNRSTASLKRKISASGGEELPDQPSTSITPELMDLGQGTPSQAQGE